MAEPDVQSKPETMGRRLASRRALLGLSQEEAASKIGITQAQMSRLESDVSSGAVDTVTKLADLYGVSLDYLVKGDTSA